MGETLRVHIVDDDFSRRAQMARQLYEGRIHAEIYEDLDELIERAPSQGVVLINDDQSGRDLEADLDALQMHAGYLPVAAFSTELSAKRIVKAISSGALEYLEWPCARRALIDAVSRVARVGERRARTARRRTEARQLAAGLTSREKDVLKALVAGLSNKETAQELGISPRTVEVHRANLISKLNARSTADAVRIGIYAGLDE